MRGPVNVGGKKKLKQNGKRQEAGGIKPTRGEGSSG